MPCTRASPLRHVPVAPRMPPVARGVARLRWDRLPDGTPVDAFTLVNARGTTVTALTLGATLAEWRVADREGVPDDILLGMADARGQMAAPYMGSLVGRCANRIAHAAFPLDGARIPLAANAPPHHLHGGAAGFDQHVWRGRAARAGDAVGVTFTRTSPDGEEGYPGTLHARVRYRLHDDDRLVVDLHATTTRPTPCNLTQHAYFNLAGRRAADVRDHVLVVHADAYLPVDATLVPTGEVAPVDDTPLDFRRPVAIGTRLDASHPQLALAGGCDHAFVLRPPQRPRALRPAAWLHDPASGRTLTVHTTAPALQVYTGNGLDGALVGSGGRRFGRHAGVCLEAQGYPDAPNRPAFPSVILRPGDTYRVRITFATGLAP